MREMEEEALKLKELQSEVDKQIGVSSPQHVLDRSNSNTSINLSYEEKVKISLDFNFCTETNSSVIIWVKNTLNRTISPNIG